MSFAICIIRHIKPLYSLHRQKNRIFIFSNSTAPGLLLLLQFTIISSDIRTYSSSSSHQPSVSPRHLPPPDSRLPQHLTGLHLQHLNNPTSSTPPPGGCEWLSG